MYIMPVEIREMEMQLNYHFVYSQSMVSSSVCVRLT